MYTQVTYAELVDRLFTNIGNPLGIEFVQPSLADLNSYENGKWLYDINGISIEVFRWGRGDVWNREAVPGYHWNDERETFEKRLEADLRAKIASLMDS